MFVKDKFGRNEAERAAPGLDDRRHLRSRTISRPRWRLRQDGSFEAVNSGEDSDRLPGLLLHPRWDRQRDAGARQEPASKVSGVFETTGSKTQFCEYGKMKQAGLDVYTDGNPWSMHHKVIIIDDETVIFGSFNFSDNADKQQRRESAHRPQH